MPISSLVLHLAPDVAAAANLESFLREDPRVTLGPRQASRLPIVLDAKDREETHAMFDAIASHPGARHVDVVFVEVDDPENSDSLEGTR